MNNPNIYYVFYLVQDYGTEVNVVGDTAYTSYKEAKAAMEEYNATISEESLKARFRIPFDEYVELRKLYNAKMEYPGKYNEYIQSGQYIEDTILYDDIMNGLYAPASIRKLDLKDRRTAFISGHRDVTEEEFQEHYAVKISSAYFSGQNFVVGDYYGVDIMAQKLLHNLWAGPDRVTVYHMFDEPRNIVDEYRVNRVYGFKTDTERDAAMTVASDYDIAWVRVGKYNSGTAQNIIRRHATPGTENV